MDPLDGFTLVIVVELSGKFLLHDASRVLDSLSKSRFC